MPKKIMSQSVRWIIALWLGLACNVQANSFLDQLNTSSPSSNSSSENTFLPAEQAFMLNANVMADHTLQFNWLMATGYYLYKHSLSFSTPSGEKLTVSLPAGIAKYDDYLGNYEIYLEPLSATVTLPKNLANPLTVTVDYQGCAADGYCYAPMQQHFVYSPTEQSVNIEINPTQESVNNTQPELNEPDRITAMLSNDNLALTFLAFFGFGLLLAFTPCVLPMIPILSSIIVGQGPNLSRKQAFLLACVYVLAVALTYGIAGALAGLAGSGLQSAFQKPWILSVMALIFVLLALSLFGFYELRLPHWLNNKLTTFSHQQRGGNLFGVFVMGIASALVISPCVSAPLVGALAYIGQSGDALLGGSALFVLALGMGLPLIIAVTLGAEFLPKAGSWMTSVKAFFGVLLLALAIELLSRFLPGPFVLLLWGCLLIGSGVFLGAFSQATNPLEKFGKSLGLICLIIGSCYLIGAAMGNSSWRQPLVLTGIQSPTNLTLTSTQSIKTVQQLQNQLAQAQKAQQAVMVSFNAEWCLACHKMKRTVLSDPQVQVLLKSMRVLEVDVTANDEDDRALQRYLGVFAPPSYVFFAADGKERRANRLVAESTKSQFLDTLKQVLAPSLN